MEKFVVLKDIFSSNLLFKYKIMTKTWLSNKLIELRFPCFDWLRQENFTCVEIEKSQILNIPAEL
jgi:hypothetical protein